MVNFAHSLYNLFKNIGLLTSSLQKIIPFCFVLLLHQSKKLVPNQS